MYKEIITLRQTTNEDTQKEIESICIAAHNNRAGKVEIEKQSDFAFTFMGEETKYGCLHLGILTLKNTQVFMENVLEWKWIDEEPDEDCDIIEDVF